MSIDPQLLHVLKSQCSLGENFRKISSSQIMAIDVNQLLFTKISSQIPQVLAEADSLAGMEQACQSSSSSSSLIPKVHAFGLTENQDRAYLVTDYKKLSSHLDSRAQKSLGENLAKMHLNATKDQFGFHRPTFCGVTEQDNAWSDSWTKFFTEQRIGHLIRRIDESSKDSELLKLECKMKEFVYPILFENFDSKFQPRLIHGDLWSGNSGVDQEKGGQVIIFDPSSYYAHNEMELGIMHMFGGYTSAFFESYHKVIPKLEPCYEERIKCYELYHHLNHALMFGGGYRSGAVQIMKSLIRFGEKESKKEEMKAEL